MLLEVTELTKAFRDTMAVDHISCTLGNGVYGLLGVNGAGKTTFMRMLCTLLLPDSGAIRWEGSDIFSMGGAYRKLLGYLPQGLLDITRIYHTGLPPVYRFHQGAAPRICQKTRRAASSAGGALGHPETEDEKALRRHEAPGGDRAGHVKRPQILILDEPTAGLDPRERIRFRNLISEIADKRLVLLSTHIVSDIEYIAGEILLMKMGN